MWNYFKSIYFYFFAGLILLLYFILRLGWQDTIEFGYDQPRLAFVVQDFIAHGSYISSQSYSLESPWGNYSWGPALVYFYLPLFYVSSNPLVVASLTAVFNSLSIVLVMYIGKRYFSEMAGLCAGLFLASHPWWEIFSRMIYQPTPVPTFIAIAILVLFIYLEKPKSIAAGFLLLLWGVLFQLYLSCVHFILPGIVAEFIGMRKGLSGKYISLGIILCALIFIPSLYYYSSNSRMFSAFFGAPQKFESRDKSIYERFIDVSMAYSNIVPGGGFEWQLGYADEIFHSKISYYTPTQVVVAVSIFSVLIYSTAILFRRKTSYRLNRLLLLLWSLGPIWFMTFVKVPDLLPRYFILILPSLALLFGIFLNDCYIRIRSKYKIVAYSVFLLPVFLSIWWVNYIVNYFTFVENYDYPLGPVSNFSDVPYVFLDKAMKWVEADALSKGTLEYIVSTDVKKPTEPALNTASHYYWEYMLKREIHEAKEDKTKYYMIQFTSEPQLTPGAAGRFGPYLVYEYIKN